MKRVSGIILIVVLAGLLSACPLNDSNSTKLRKDLGSYQYQGLNPELSFVVKKADFKPPQGSYSHATLIYTVSVKQNNASFPLKEYRITALGSIVDSDGHEVDRRGLRGEVANGVLSMSDIDTLYGKIGDLSPTEVSNLHLRITSYIWEPIVTFRPYENPS